MCLVMEPNFDNHDNNCSHTFVLTFCGLKKINKLDILYFCNKVIAQIVSLTEVQLENNKKNFPESVDLINIHIIYILFII